MKSRILTAEWQNHPKHLVRGAIELRKLHPTIRANYYKGDYDRIENSIHAKGMRFPVVTWEATVDEWNEWASQSADLLGPPISVRKFVTCPVLLVMCGNNRLQYAYRYSYDYIDTIICPTKEDVSRLCSMMRRDWRAEDRISLEAPA